MGLNLLSINYYNNTLTSQKPELLSFFLGYERRKGTQKKLNVCFINMDMSVVPTSYIVSCHAWLKTCDIYAQTNACTITSKCCKQLISNIFQNMICKYG